MKNVKINICRNRECQINHGCKHISGTMEDFLRGINCYTCCQGVFFFNGKDYCSKYKLLDIYLDQVDENTGNCEKYENEEMCDKLWKIVLEYYPEIESDWTGDEEFYGRKGIGNLIPQKSSSMFSLTMSNILMRCPKWVEEYSLMGGDIELIPQEMIDLIKRSKKKPAKSS